MDGDQLTLEDEARQADEIAFHRLRVALEYFCDFRGDTYRDEPWWTGATHLLYKLREQEALAKGRG